MAAQRIPCKVIIVGGSIAGLSLANMLERFGIEFVVLEAYKEIAPQVGASIAIYPHFARILDQIGCWVRKLVDKTVNHGFYRNKEGGCIFDFRGLADGLEKRHGYPVIFIERQMLLKALYENLQSKEKVFLEKRFVQMNHNEDGVRVTMQDGSSYEGDILIGADGMYSSVRKSMHKFGKSVSPKSFDHDEYSRVPCTYKCIFGMSYLTKGIEKGTNHIVMGEGHSYLILTGPGKTYWFLQVKNSETTYGKGVPNYTVEDERRLAESHFEDRLNEYDTFGDLYRNKIISRLTPLHEYQWKRWYFGRVMTIGDANHKLHPISGNGGAAAIEDAAVLVNALLSKLGQSPGHLSTNDFQDIFSKAQHDQENRTAHLIKHATKMQDFDAMESIFAPLIVRFVIPNLTDDAALAIVGANTVQGQRIKYLPVPKRDRYVPYEDELPVKPLKIYQIDKLFFMNLHALLFYLAYSSSSFSQHLTRSLSIVIPDPYLNIIAEYFVPAIKESGDHHENSSYSTLSSILLILMWNIEGHRRGNMASLGSWAASVPLVAALSFADPATVVALCFLLAVCNSCRPAYSSVAGRPVAIMAVKASILTSYVISAGLLTLKLSPPEFRRIIQSYSVGLGPYIPLLISALVQLLTYIIPQKPESTDKLPWLGKEHLRIYSNEDYTSLLVLYRIIFVLGLITHISELTSFHNRHLVTINTVAYCLQSALEMRNLGYTTNFKAISAMIVILLGTIAFGPIAVYALTWHWRESVIYRLSNGIS